MRIALLKVGALGDVLRTTSILPGLAARHPGLDVTWVTDPGAVDLVRGHPRVARTVPFDARGADEAAVERLACELCAGGPFERVLAFDDEVEVCRLATRLAARGGRISGAFWDPERGERRYTDDVAPWFDMGLLSVHGKREADRRKLANRESHPALFARMLGIRRGEPELPLPAAARARAAALAERTGLHAGGLAIGLNPGAGERWPSKRLGVERTAELVRALDARLAGRARFLLLGGSEERERNAAIRAAAEAQGSGGRLVDAGTDHALLDFAALVARCDLLVTSDTLALHVGIATRVPIVAFFAPTPAHEIELYGRGEAVASTASDYASYRPDADTRTITAERLSEAALRVLRAAGRL